MKGTGAVLYLASVEATTEPIDTKQMIRKPNEKLEKKCLFMVLTSPATRKPKTVRLLAPSSRANLKGVKLKRRYTHGQKRF
jgi:hypothetical protein